MFDQDSETGGAGTRTPVISARGLAKSYGSFQALHPTDLDIPLGRIVGLIGANGAGKTTMLQAILGLRDFDGELSVLGHNPASDRNAMMEDICFIADVATLPKWMRVREVIDFVEKVHPRFDKAKALDFLSRTQVPLERKVKALSKGMTVQVHLAVVMSIDAKLLVLDEPTLGLDILFRKEFYRALLEEYFDEQRTILITTHQVEEVEHILTDVMFIRDGRLLLYRDMDALSEEFLELACAAGKESEAEALGPIDRTRNLGSTSFAFRGVSATTLAELGDVRRMNLADIFVATMQDNKKNGGEA